MSSDPQPGRIELIVLLDEQGNPVGQAEKWSSHHLETPLHLAFSCYVLDDLGRLLVTQRAAGKKVWPGVWTNSVCGHPQPGESIEDAIRRRLDYELGMTAEGLQVVLPDYRYKAPPFDGVVENEYCPVYLARATSDPHPNPEEVEGYEWLSWNEFVRRTQDDAAGRFSWWCKDQTARLRASEILRSRLGSPKA